MCHGHGDRAYIFRSFTFTLNGDENKYEVVLQKSDEHFVPKRNVIHERARFHQLCQKPGESVEHFFRNLYELAERCEYSEHRRARTSETDWS